MSEEKHEHVRKGLKQILINNFIGGIAWGLGATVGGTIILALLGYLLSRINLVPIVGVFATQITDFVLQNSSNLLK